MRFWKWNNSSCFKSSVFWAMVFFSFSLLEVTKDGFLSMKHLIILPWMLEKLGNENCFWNFAANDKFDQVKNRAIFLRGTLFALYWSALCNVIMENRAHLIHFWICNGQQWIKECPKRLALAKLTAFSSLITTFSFALTRLVPLLHWLY